MFRNFKKRLISGFMAAVMTISNITPLTPIVAETELEETTAEIEIMTESETESENTELLHQSFELYPNEEEPDKTVTLEGLMPEGAEAQAVDVSEEHDGIVAYDITITDGETEYQPGEENPILVEIVNPVISETESVELWHIHDDDTREQIFDFSLEDGKISFYATGFSVYEIVTNAIQLSNDSFIDLLTENGEKTGGYLVSATFGSRNVSYYLQDQPITYNTTPDTRGGIKLTDDAESGSYFYFEKVEDEEKFYIYTLDSNSERKYIKMYLGDFRDNAGTAKGERSALSFASNTSERTPFIIVDKDGGNRFKLCALLRNSTNLGNGDYWVANNGDLPTGMVGYKNRGDVSIAWITIHGLTDDPYKLDGKTYGLMNYTNGTVGNALMADSEKNFYTQLFQLITRDDLTSTTINTLYVLKDADITMWTFEAAEEDYYYISTVVNGVKKYLNIGEYDNSDDHKGITLTDENSKQKIKVTPDSKGSIQLSADGYALSFHSDGNNSQFETAVSSTADTSQYLAFVEKSAIEPAEVITYSANKISVCTPDDGDEVIVYTRIWNDATNTYDFYAVDSDGSLYPCYEKGDNIMWTGHRVNTLLWNLTVYTAKDKNNNDVENYYYELYNPYSKKYIAPQFTPKAGDTAILSNNKIGINLPGRRDGEYYSTILAWDDSEYTYAGLVNENNQLTIQRRNKAGTFYFATMAEITPALTEVDTVDNTLHGITMKMVDFNGEISQYTGEHDDSSDDGYTNSTTTKIQHDVIGYSMFKVSPQKSGLLTTNLADTVHTGYPIANYTNKSLYELFSTAEEVNHLFIQSTYDATGYFEFDSCQNFATLNGDTSGDFTVYKELGTTSDSASTLQHGQFFPYNTIIQGVYSNNYNRYTALAKRGDATTGALPQTDPRYNERLYSVGTPNYYLGMELEASFIQTPDGKDDWDHPIIFEFTGDDDFWLYVDGELVIDLGGIHSALAGNVNFATGKVVVNNVETTLRDIFIQHYKDRDGLTQEGAEARANEKFTQKENETVVINGTAEPVYVFNDYSQHTMKIFYMERGAGASNLHMRFNLSSVTPGNVMVTKTLTGKEALEEDIDSELIQYPYQIFYKVQDAANGEIINQITDPEMENFSIYYKNSTRTVDFVESYTIPDTGITIHHVFFLNPDKSVEIHFPDNTISYKIVECGINSDVYDYQNGKLNNASSIPVMAKTEYDTQFNTNPTPVIVTYNSPYEKFYDFDSGWQQASDRPNVVFTNNIKNSPLGFQKLYIKKQLYAEDGSNMLSKSDDKTTFSFRLYLTNGISDNLVLADMYTYHVVDENGNYCKWNVASQEFVSLETNVFSSISNDNDKIEATFETSMNGAISKIPAGYSVVIPNLPIGSKFKVEEWDSEIPLGYEFKEYECDNSSYNFQANINEGTVKLQTDPKMNICNQRGWGIEATKTWSDSPFIESHDPIYVAVYAGNDLIPGTGRAITNDNLYVRYFFESLLSGKEFKDYQIYEVTLNENPVFDSNGNPTDESIGEKMTNGRLFNVSAIHKANGNIPDDYSYKVEYDGVYVDEGHVNIINSATGNVDVNGNTISESITNTRTNGVEIFLYDMMDYDKESKTTPLENGVFTLTQNGVNMGSFTSDKDGKITILYSNTGTFQSGATYVLTQTAAPSKYIKTPFSVAFSVDGNSKIVNIYQNGIGNEPPGKWADGAPKTNSDEIIAKINIYNKQVELKAVKVDSKNTNKTLSGAVFDLYRGVKGIDGLGKDNIPVYQNLTTDANGVIPNIDINLPADTYFLTEKTAPSNYEKLTKDIQFTIHENGEITLDSAEQGELMSEPDDTTDKYSYQISIPNTSLSSDYYFDIEKIIFVDKNVHDSDTEQKFIFKVERFEEDTTDFTTSPTRTFYVTLNCDKEMTYTNDTNITLASNNSVYNYNYNFYHTATSNDATKPRYEFISSGVKIQRTYSTDTYTFPAAIWNGRQTVHVTEDGIYRISEVSGWSDTDYDFWTGSNRYKGYGDGSKGETVISDGFRDSQTTGTNTLPDDDKKCVYINVSEVKADQFKTESAVIDSRTVFRPTASFTNSETEFAYLSSQAYAENTIKR